MRLSRLSATRVSKRPCIKRRALFWPAFLPLILLSSVLVNWIFLAQVAFAAPLAPYSAPGHTTFQQFLKEGQKSTAPHGKFVRPTEPKPKKPVTQPKPLPSAEPATMQPISLQLSSTQISANMVGVSGVKPLNLIGNDGRLEVRVPAGAFDLSHAQTSQGTTPAGPFTLRLSQVHGHATGLLNLLGAYQIQVLDGQHKPLNKIALRVPLTIIYHYQLWELQALDLNPAQIFLSWPGLIAAGKQAKTSTAKDLVLFTNNAATHTLTAQTSVIDTMATLTVGSEPANQSVAPPHFATVQGNSGNAGYTYPLQIAPAPAGFAPTLQLVYSSGDPNGRHSQTAAASDVGDGWAISLGSITETTQANPNGSGTITVYSLSGVDNVSDRLVPDPNNSGFFLTEHLSRIRIHQRTSSSTNQICFHVWDLSGNYYEFGCTPDSLQYYTTAAGRVNYRWDLDLERSATDGPNTASDEIVVHYLQDIVTVGGYTSIRDAALEQVQYGTLASNGTTFTPSGTVDFHYHAPTASTGHDGLNQPWAVAYPQNYNCATTPPTATTLRCDDPLADGSVAAPSTMSTMTLDTIETFVGSDTSASHLDYAYALAYNQDTPFATCQDPNSGVSLYCAGEPHPGQHYTQRVSARYCPPAETDRLYVYLAAEQLLRLNAEEPGGLPFQRSSFLGLSDFL